MNNASYLIHRVNLDIEAPDLTTARRVQDEAVRIFYDRILPKLEQLLNRLLSEDVVYRLDSLDLDLKQLESAGFEQDFSETVLHVFEEKVKRIIAVSPSPQAEEEIEPYIILSAEERLFATFLAFLATGRLPWWSEAGPEVLQEEALTEPAVFSRPESVQRLFRLLGSNSSAVERLLLQFSPGFVTRIIMALLQSQLPVRSEAYPAVIDYLNRLGAERPLSPAGVTELQHTFLRVIIHKLTVAAGGPLSPEGDNRLTPAELERIYREMSEPSLPRREYPPSSSESIRSAAMPTTGTSRDYSEGTLEEQKQQEEEEDGIYVTHAGLVLLHPFLEYFFKEFNMLHDGAFVDSSARNLAVHLLHYLAVGEECPPEYLLTLEKFLCGADLLSPIPRFIRLSDPMKAESEKLLQAAIGHWQALKRTSPAGLREGFLQRSGKLLPSNFQNRLIIEAKAHDVLLNYLPWGYGIIKLPWLKQPLFVDWTS